MHKLSSLKLREEFLNQIKNEEKNIYERMFQISVSTIFSKRFISRQSKLK